MKLKKEQENLLRGFKHFFLTFYFLYAAVLSSMYLEPFAWRTTTCRHKRDAVESQCLFFFKCTELTISICTSSAVFQTKPTDPQQVRNQWRLLKRPPRPQDHVLFHALQAAILPERQRLRLPSKETSHADVGSRHAGRPRGSVQAAGTRRFALRRALGGKKSVTRGIEFTSSDGVCLLHQLFGCFVEGFRRG